ncbi:MAG: type II CAAX endopeptidase family protein [Planctomycetota bacterium]
MQTADYLVGAFTLALLAVSTGLWINLLRQGIGRGWSWPVQPRRDVPWRPWEAVVTIILVLFYVSAVLQWVTAPVAGSPESASYSLQRLQYFALSQVAELMLIPLILGIWCRCRWEDFGLRRHGLLTDLRFAVWGVLLAQLPVRLVEYPLQALRKANPHPVLELLLSSGSEWQTLAWIALEVVVLAPLVEELLFRVLLQGALEREIPAGWAILLTAIAFAGIHQPTDWLPLLPLALILGYVYYRRRSFVAIVVLHGLFNAISLVCALWLTKMPV